MISKCSPGFLFPSFTTLQPFILLILTLGKLILKYMLGLIFSFLILFNIFGRKYFTVCQLDDF